MKKKNKFYVVNGCAISEEFYNESYNNGNNDREIYDYRKQQNGL